MEKFSESITIDGELFDYNPEDATALIPCENCGHINVVEVSKVDGDYVPSSFSCENCGHWNSFD
ncbi:hypothetical protein DPF_0168 [Desulfoplanes formicivorans]|uniref:Uncharacterized protein n=2 Tax=Desulfoplanes formicivorans TaxID=1592317 RepID=A0A194AFC7_9BACT|nr:hypothetical protein DPF_0168 [Desulfoplanes formicivorans]